MHTDIAVIGDRGSIQGFKAVGFSAYEATCDVSIAGLVSELANMNYGIIFITEDLFEMNADVIEMYKNDMLPAIIPIPGKNGNRGNGIKNIHKNVERAVGADIFNN